MEDGKLIYTEKGEDRTDYIYKSNTVFAEIRREREDEAVYYHHTDHLGTTRAVSDENGAVVWEAETEAFGSVLSENGTKVFTASYTGKLYDEDAGMYYFNARWYDSEIGRFVTEDPARDGVNWYAYCGGNPVTRYDWTGLEECEVVIRAGHKKTVWQKMDDELTRFCYRNFVLGGSYQADDVGNQLIRTMDGRKITLSHSGEKYFSNGEKNFDRLFTLVNLFNSELGLLAKTGAFTSAAQSVGKARPSPASAGKVNTTAIAKSPSDLARASQGNEVYSGIDIWTDTVYPPGSEFYRGSPNGTDFWTTRAAVESSGRDAERLFNGLQVQKNARFGYRDMMEGFKSIESINGAYGRALANPQFGSGGLPQEFIPNSDDLIKAGKLVPIENIQLKK